MNVKYTFSNQQLLMLGLMVLACGLQAIGGTALPWETPLVTLQMSLTGPVAGTISVLALFAAGGMLVFGGEMSEVVKKSLYVVLGSALVMGGASLVKALFPQAITTGCGIL